MLLSTVLSCHAEHKLTMCPLLLNLRLCALLDSWLDLSLFYASVITSAQNEHKKDNDKDDSRSFHNKIVIMEDHLIKADIQLL